ncbi:MAG: ATP-binding protein [Candidatus Eremiobacteraeota bacterium]|nr:ATP-binding protein [Candidatus Eremiobacteraeota bacterium]
MKESPPPVPFEEPEVRLRFEALLADLSAHFINLPPDRVDGEIGEAQRRVCEFLRVDLSAVWQWSDDPQSLTLTHLYRPLGGPPLPEPADSREMFPWCMQRLRAGKIIAVSVENLPPEAAIDQAQWRQFGIKTSLTFPLAPGGGPLIGALSFNDMQTDRNWSEVLMRRLELVAQIFANALARKRSDELLRESQERLSLATESAGVGLWSMELLTSRVWVTSKTRRLFNFTPDEELSYESFFRVIHPDDHDAVHRSIQQAMDTNTGLFIEYRIIVPDGSIRWVSSRGHPRSIGEGKPDRLMGVSVDITGRRRAEMEAQALREELFHVTRVTTLGLLTASIAHEVNQPLAAILINAEAALRLLARETPDLPEVRDALRDIVDDDRRAVEVILRLRGMLKKEEPKREPLDLNSTIHQVVTIVSGEAAMQGFSIRLELEDRLPELMGDSIQIQQIILNLLHNATEAMTGIQVGPKEIVIRTGVSNPGFAAISVSDSGAGIAEADLERIFGSFYTTKPHGMGMGLAVSRSIAEAHGGRLWASRNPGRGATFHLSLPTA